MNPDCVLLTSRGSVLFRHLGDVAGAAAGLGILVLVLLLDVHGREGCAAQGDHGESGDDGGSGFLHFSSCPYSGLTVPRSIEVPGRGTADRVGLQPDGATGRPGICAPETTWGEPAHESVHAIRPRDAPPASAPSAFRLESRGGARMLVPRSRPAFLALLLAVGSSVFLAKADAERS